MNDFGKTFIEAIPRHIASLKIPGRSINGDTRRPPLPAKIEGIEKIQKIMNEVLEHPCTQNAHRHTQSAFLAFLKQDSTNAATLSFFNGWNETHKTTSLVSAKVIMRLSSESISMCSGKQSDHNMVLAHMHEVAKDDFGLGHEGHDGMYHHLIEAFGATDWMKECYTVDECNTFSSFLYQAGVKDYKSAIQSPEYNQSIIDAMMISISSELWNGREYNFLAQFIEEKLLSQNPALRGNPKNLRNAKAYVLGHSGEVENKHGLHALAAAQAFGRMVGVDFDTHNLKRIMLNYNERIGQCFRALNERLVNPVSI